MNLYQKSQADENCAKIQPFSGKQCHENWDSWNSRAAEPQNLYMQNVKLLMDLCNIATYKRVATGCEWFPSAEATKCTFDDELLRIKSSNAQHHKSSHRMPTETFSLLSSDVKETLRNPFWRERNFKLKKNIGKQGKQSR